MEEIQLLTIDEAAKRLRVHAWTLRDHAAQGSLRVVRLGRAVRVPASELARVAAEGLPSVARKRRARGA